MNINEACRTYVRLCKANRKQIEMEHEVMDVDHWLCAVGDCPIPFPEFAMAQTSIEERLLISVAHRYGVTPDRLDHALHHKYEHELCKLMDSF